MRRRLLALAAPLIVGFIVATTLFMGRDRFARPLFLHDADDGLLKIPEIKPVVDGWCSPLDSPFGCRFLFVNTTSPC